MQRFNKLSISVLTFLLAGCGSTATYLSPQQSVFYKDNASIELADSDLNQLFSLSCMKSMPQGAFTFGAAKEAPQCLYIAVDASKASYAKSTDRAVRDKAIAYLLSISENNCSNYLDRAFANRSEMDISKNLTQDVTTGVGSMAAFNTPALTAGLGLVNLIVGKSVDNVNSTYYFNQTYQAFAAAVATERARIKSEIISKQANRPTVSTENIVQYTLFDAFSDIREYDAACSMRVGLAKLLETQGEKKQAQFKQSAIADELANKKSLQQAKQAQSTDFQK